MTQIISDKTAIAGIGLVGFSADSGKSELRLACECIQQALDDAGLSVRDVDGLIHETADSSDEYNVISAMGIENLNYFSESRWGSGASCAFVMHAAAAVATGVANTVVCYRAVNGASGRRFAGPTNQGPFGYSSYTLTLSQLAFYPPFGLATQDGWVAMTIKRYMHEFGVSEDAFGSISVVCRENAARNPNALYTDQPITIQDYQSSEFVVEPLRTLDICSSVDGAVAMIVTSAERARQLKQKPAHILAAAQGSAADGELLSSFNRPSLSGLAEMNYMGRDLFQMAQVSRKDIDVVQLDDSYAPFVPMQLEELGFCDRGDGASFCANGDRIGMAGELPLNTSGGSLGEGNMFGMNHIAEAVRQIRGTSASQVKNANLVLVASGAGGPASGLILRG